MANEIQVDYQSGHTLYAVRRNSLGQVALSDGSGWENWGNAGHNSNDYDVSLTDKNGNRYIGDFDAGGNIAAGRYSVQVFLQASANPADTDELIGSGEIVWTSKGEMKPEKILVNKAVQDKSTGKIDYYDDDGQTIILTHTPNDGESIIERTPS